MKFLVKRHLAMLLLYCLIIASSEYVTMLAFVMVLVCRFGISSVRNAVAGYLGGYYFGDLG